MARSNTGALYNLPSMPTRLIINADDFGLTPGINCAIAELHAARVLPSATLMASGPAFDYAVKLAREHPTLGVGAHIVLTDGVPISSPESIPTLLGPDRRTLRPTLSTFVAALLAGRIRPDDIYREAFAQIRRIQASGIRLTHLDTHKHTHLFPQVAAPILRAAADSGVPAVRYPFEPSGTAALTRTSTPLTRRMQLHALHAFEPAFRKALGSEPTVRTTRGTFGISATGSLTSETLRTLLAAIRSAPPGTYELCCHPGYNDADLAPIRTRLRAHREMERTALLTEIPKLLAHPDAPTLISYAGL